MAGYAGLKLFEDDWCAELNFAKMTKCANRNCGNLTKDKLYVG
jgi:hypothetical protein